MRFPEVVHMSTTTFYFVAEKSVNLAFFEIKIKMKTIRVKLACDCREWKRREKTKTRSRIHERTISLRFHGIILRVLRLEISMINVYITLQTSFKPLLPGVAGGENFVRRGDCEYQGGKLLRILS
jgi:hypothetical protein